MTGSISEEIERGWRLLNEGKEAEALQIVNEFEKKEDLSPEELLRCQILKGFILFVVGRLEDALKIGDQIKKESIKLNKDLLTIDGIFIKFGALISLERGNESWDELMYVKELLTPLLKEPNSEVEQRELIFLFMRGWFHWARNENDLALQHVEKCLEMVKRHSRLIYLEQVILGIMGHSYANKGELGEALKAHERSLEVSIGDSHKTKVNKATSLDSIGTIHYQKGNLDLAIEHYKKSLKTCEEFNFMGYIGLVYDHLIAIYLDKGAPKLASEYLERFQQYNEKKGSYWNSSFSNLSRARVLKSSTRTRDRAKAEQMLKELSANVYPMINYPALIALCDLYFQELKVTNDLEILEDIQPLVERLINESERTNSYSQRAHAFLLNGKISLLQLNMGDARRYLMQAQQIADSHGLQLLAREISHEHDKLLEQLGRLEGYKKNEITPSERLNIASLDKTMDLMQGKREIKAPELTAEEPVLLLILTTGGALIFSHSFADEWGFDSELFGGFLTAFNSISDEIFSEGLDRVKFGQHTVLMESVANFSVCYLYKGQTYLAKRKLVEFTGVVHEDASIEQILEKFEKTSQVLQMKDFPFLKPLITQIFIKN
jgi:tetratricopeptide (TPR) repeat protein